MNSYATKVLLVEDDPDDAFLLGEKLDENSQFRVEMQHALNLSDGIKVATSESFDAVLLDLNLPDSRGLDTLKRGLKEMVGLPIIVLSGLEDEQIAIQAVRSGAQDYLIKGQETPEILARVIRYSIERNKAQADTQRRVQQLGALHRIDNAISSTMPIDQVIETFLDIAISQLSVDATTVYMLDEDKQTLKLAWAKGMRAKAAITKELDLSETIAGLTVSKNNMFYALDLEKEELSESFREIIEAEEFVFYGCVPLIAKERKKGILEVFCRRPFEPDKEWLDFFETLAGQAAIAIQDAEMVASLRQAKSELETAYDATLKGWVRALDLRDHETEGHTQRVTDLAIRLASSFGYDVDDLVHMTRGALLHDVGKIGISDGILSKPGALTDEEREQIQMHPVYAFEWLDGIDYLRPALDIPHYHHEKWDGSGYPEGLAGESIPHSARLFAVVDVFDALTSDRPYRKAWSREKTLDYISSEAGKHFEPEVVDRFQTMINSN